METQKKKSWRISIYFSRRGERDLLDKRYDSQTQAELAAYNINQCDARLEARAEEEATEDE